MTGSVRADCRLMFGIFAKIGHYGVALPVKHFGKTAFYPAIIGAKSGPTLVHLRNRDLPGAGSAFGKIILEDKWHILAYGVMANLYRYTGISVNQFMQITQEFDKGDDEIGLTVVVDAFSSDDPLYSGAGSYVFKAHYSNNPNAVLVSNVKNWRELLEKLERVVHERGKIKKLDFYGHGFPGISIVGNDPNSIPGLGSEPNRQLFRRGAQIRFVSCFVGNGPRGDEFHKNLPRYLTPLGATVWTSKVQVVPNLLELAAFKTHSPEPPKWARNAAEPLSVVMGIWTALSMLEVRGSGRQNHFNADGPFISERTQVRKVPPDKDMGDMFDGERADLMQEIYEARSKQFNLVARQYNYVREDRERIKQIDPRDDVTMDSIPRRRAQYSWSKLMLQHVAPIDLKHVRLRDTPGIEARITRLEDEVKPWLTAEHVLNPEEGVRWLEQEVVAAKAELNSEFLKAKESLEVRKRNGFLSPTQFDRAIDESTGACNFFKGQIERIAHIARNRITGDSK